MENNTLGNGTAHQTHNPAASTSRGFRGRSKKTEREEDLPPDAYNALLYSYFSRHEFRLCKEIIDKEIEKWAGYCEYPQFLKGLILKREGKVQEALRLFETCKDLNRFEVDHYTQIAKCLFLLGDQREAIKVFEEAEKMDDSLDWEIPYYIGECNLRIDKFEEAEAQFIRSTKCSNQENPFDSLAKLYVQQGRMTDAITIYKQALKLDSEHEQISTDLGLLYMGLGDVKRAFQQFGEILAKKPDCDRATFATAYIMQIQKEFDAAFSKYKIASHTMLESWALWNNIGMCLYGKQKLVSAITCLKKAHYLNPLALPPACNLGIVYLATGQYASAAIYSCAAVSSDPNVAMPYLLLGLALKKLNDLEGSEKALEKAHCLSPQDPTVLINYAVVLDAANKQDQVKELLSTLRDVTAIIEVDVQITKTAKLLSSKLSLEETFPSGSSSTLQMEETKKLDDDEV